MRTLVLKALFLVLATTTTSLSKEAFEGIWATSDQECRDKEGPNSRTYIDLSYAMKGRRTPIIDQYENHCRIVSSTTAGRKLRITATCYDSWEDFESGNSGAKAIFMLDSITSTTIELDQKRYIRCFD
jgi:hypothetical protein